MILITLNLKERNGPSDIYIDKQLKSIDLIAKHSISISLKYATSLKTGIETYLYYHDVQSMILI